MAALVSLLCAVTLPALAQGESRSGSRRGASYIMLDTGHDLMTIYMANDLSVQIQYKNQTDWQVSPPWQPLADSGFFASFGGNTYGPDFGSHPETSVPPAQFPIPWTMVVAPHQEGNGTVDDPFYLSTTVSAGGALDVKQEITYIFGNKYAYLEWKATNNSAVPLDCWFTHAVAMYMQGDGGAYGYYDPSTGGVGGYNAPWNFYESLIPRYSSTTVQPTAYEVNDYLTIWNHIIGNPPGTGIGLQNYVNPNYINVAVGLQWSYNIPASGEADMKDEWKMGENPPYPPTPSPTPVPPPTPTPLLYTTLNSTTPAAGSQFTVDVTVQPVNQRFDAYAVIIGGGKKYSMVLNKPGRIRGGLYAYITRMKKLTRAYSGHLLNIQIPSGVTGSYQVIVGLVPSGKKPSVRNVIPGYLAQTPVTVTKT